MFNYLTNKPSLKFILNLIIKEKNFKYNINCVCKQVYGYDIWFEWVCMHVIEQNIFIYI